MIPLIPVAAATVVGVTTCVVLTPIVVPAALGVVGFGAPHTNNVGTMAAGMQAGIGNVAAGSLFATAQSVAMGGAVPAVVTAVGAGMGAVGGAAVGATSVGAAACAGAASVGISAASAVGAGISAAAVGIASNVATYGVFAAL